jgi:hypothetical protein
VCVFEIASLYHSMCEKNKMMMKICIRLMIKNSVT